MINRLSDRTAQDSTQLWRGRSRSSPQWSTPGQPDRVDLHAAPLGGSRQPHRRHDEAGDRLHRGQRFGAHNGVDLQGSLTGLAGYLQGAVDTRGGSTIEQQYVKNYNFLVNAQTDAERRAADRDHSGAQTAGDADGARARQGAAKAEILTRYLNLVSFGNGSFGVQDAAKTYFGVNAADLNWQQSALLAGMVQSTSALNPYTNPEARWRDATWCSTP